MTKCANSHKLTLLVVFAAFFELVDVFQYGILHMSLRHGSQITNHKPKKSVQRRRRKSKNLWDWDSGIVSLFFSATARS